MSSNWPMMPPVRVIATCMTSELPMARTIHGPRTDAPRVHGDRLRAGVAELVHQIGERAVVERAVDPHGDPGSAHGALTFEHTELRDLPLGLGERSLPARDRVARRRRSELEIDDLVTESVVPFGETGDERRERRRSLELKAPAVDVLRADLRHREEAEKERDQRESDRSGVAPH